MVVLIGFEMFREEVNFLGQDGNLDFGGTSVSFGAFVLSDEFLFFFFCE